MGTRRIFLVHHSEDLDVIKHYVIDPLEKELFGGLKVEFCYDAKDFKPGKPVTENIGELIQKCHCTFVFLTKTALDRNWVRYETLLALEKSQRQGRLCVTLVLFDLDQMVTQKAWFGLLPNALMIKVNLNKKNWEEELRSDIVQKIKDPTPLQPVLINANLSVGQVWSHFTGYAAIVLPKLHDLICSTTLYQTNTGRFPTIEFNLIPQSAKTVRSLTELDPAIQYVEDLPVITVDRGSYRNRKYKIPVYSIIDPETKQKYYFVAQIPNTLSILSKLEEQSKSDDRTGPMLNLSRGERSLQVAKFYFAYNRLVNHPGNKHCNNTVKLICYNDRDNVVEILIKAIKQECDKMTATEQVTQGMENICIGETTEVCSDFCKTVNIEFHPDCPTDVETANTVKEYLCRNNLKVWDGYVGGKTEFEDLDIKLKHCKWCVIVLSSAALHRDDCRLLTFRWRTALHESVLQNEVRVIPILDDMNEDDIPGDLSAVTFLKKQEPNYLEKLLKIIQCGSIKMEATVSARDVHQGLAWAYVNNYLEVTLKNHMERLSEIQKMYPTGSIYTKLLIIVPSSCETNRLKALDVDEHGHQIDPRFKQLDEIHLQTEAVSGVKHKDYQLIPYRIKTTEMDCVVTAECPNPILCLKEMANMSVLSGLQHKDLHGEAWKFKELTQNIIDTTESVKNKAKLLYYDDSQRTVAEAILEALKDEDLASFLHY